MRIRLVVLVALTSSVVLIAFLVPLSLLVRTVAADRATNAATHQAEQLATVVGTSGRDGLEAALRRIEQSDSQPYPMTVFLGDGTVLGSPAEESSAVDLARTGRSLTVDRDGGREVLVATQQGSGDAAVTRTFVTDEQLGSGVLATEALLVALGVVLLALSVLVADRLGRTIVAPIDRLVQVVHRLADGDLTARADPAGPREVRQVAGGVNLLAGRVTELLEAERDHVADLSHELRTPLTALRLSVESIDDEAERERVSSAMEALERRVDTVIREARRPAREGAVARCDASAVVTWRLDFWAVLAEDEHREVTSRVPTSPLWARLSEHDLSTVVDALLGNVFAHTEERAPFAVELSALPGGGGALTVTDHGPGLDGAKGEPAQGSTGLGLDIVRRTARAAGGEVTLTSPPTGGLRVRMTFATPRSIDRPEG